MTTPRFGTRARATARAVRAGLRVRGSTLSARLLGLVLVPLLALALFAAAEVRIRAESAANAQRAERLIGSIAELSKVRSALLQELVPGMARTIVQLSGDQSLAAVSPAELGLTDGQIERLRRTTDAAIHALITDRSTVRLGRDAERGLAAIRTQIDGGIGPGIVTGFGAAAQLIGRLTVAQGDRVDAAARAGLNGRAGAAANDLARTTQVVQFAELELPRLAGSLFPGLGNATVVSIDPAPDAEPLSGHQAWLQVWGGYRAAAMTLLTEGAPPLRRALRAAIHSPAGRAFDKIAAAAADDPTTFTISTLIELYRVDAARSQAMGRVLDLAVDRAVTAVADQRHAATTALWEISAILALVGLLSGLIGWRVLRSIARPLRTLAASAHKVSRGVLEDVRVAGPREVRTVARGLAAAVANLRRIEAQARAVSAGALDSDVVRRPLPGPLGKVVHASIDTIVGAIHDRDAAQTDLAHRAAHDPLTDLPNRARALSTIEDALRDARRQGAVTGLLFVDLDHFKQVNDTHGHETGDRVLVVCARRMQHLVRSGDVVARLGGDEFVILLEDVTSGVEVAGLADRIVQSLAEPIDAGGRHVRIGASVGVAISTDAEVDAGRLLRDADAAAYEAKKAGRGRFSVFDDELRAELARRADLDRAIAEALHRGEFELHYQPLVNLASGRAHGTEALIRWRRPGHDLVPPAEFIPQAEGSRLIVDIGRWSLFEATAQLARWDCELGIDPLRMGVNISGRHVTSGELVRDVRDALDASGVEPGRLVIEVTETMLIDNLTAVTTLAALRDLGVRVAIDDFGTGFTSIGQLSTLPVDSIKIDRAFVASPDPAQRELMALMARAAHTFGLAVVAEGIEEPWQLADLGDYEIEFGQGFGLARPQPAESVITALREPALPARLGPPAG